MALVVEGRSIEELVGLLAETREDSANLYRELERRAGELGLPLEFSVEHRSYRADENGLWAAPGRDGNDVEAIEPEEYLDALRDYLLEQIRRLSAANRDFKELIKRFTRRKASWAELKQAAEG